MAEKAQDDIDSQTGIKHRYIIRKEFWAKLIPLLNTKNKTLPERQPQ